MKAYLLTFACLLVFLNLKAQYNNTYFVNAPSGLIVREQPNSKAGRIGKLPYGKLVELVETTQQSQTVVDNGDTIKGFWVKVKYNDALVVVSDMKPKDNYFSYFQEAYVFNGYLEKLIKASISTTEIDSVKFEQLFVEPEPYNPIKITSPKEIEKALSGKVTWKDIEEYGEYVRVPDKIHLDNGQLLRVDTQGAFSLSAAAYYPTEKILKWDIFHSGIRSISLKTGETLETIGDPTYVNESPNKKFRLNGWLSTQGVMQYFFQEKQGDHYIYLTPFGGDDLPFPWFDKFCWINDREFVFSYAGYTDGGKKNERYFIGEIKGAL